ncbi:MAG TPA: hypothetical protein VGW12_21960 [Pyrinomonadaceae bacterium]|nr:hypothetical protein [Pyrinomonadaceae bacterium]
MKLITLTSCLAAQSSQVVRLAARCALLLPSLALLLGAPTQIAHARAAQQAMQESAARTVRAEIPPDLNQLDAAALIREVAESERAMQPRRLEYTWTAKVTERETGKRGEFKKETVKVYEVYPVRGEFVRKLVSENGVPLSAQEAEKQFKKAVANLEKAAREEEKRGAPRAPAQPTAAGANAIPSFGFSSGFKFRDNFSTGEFSFAPWRFLRAGEFFAARRERLGGREVIVLDFRPRADFVAVNDLQKPYAKLCGRVWIDVADRALARLEAWPLAPSATHGASQLAPITRPDAPAIVYEETRLPDGLWLESLVRIKTTADKAIFNGVEVDTEKAAFDFKRFTADAGEAKVDSPPAPTPPDEL